MATSSPQQAARMFLSWCEQHHRADEEAAAALERFVEDLLSDAHLPFLMVSARAKTIESIRAKLLRKPYTRPRYQLTDRLGVRVIVHHAREVDDVAVLLRSKFSVREKHSSDKRASLGLREFGYRSYHLVASLPRGALALPLLPGLRSQIFEVQIRSLLEHAWAEIEHDVIYKSGADWPQAINRRFASVAAVLELLEHDFDQLTQETAKLIGDAVSSMESGINVHRHLDVPFMCAVLEIERPDGLSFRGARAEGNPFLPGIEQRLQLGLRRAKIETVGAFLRVLRSRRMKECTRKYAYAEGIRRHEVSHLALLALGIGIRAPAILRVFFPELAEDQSIRVALRRP